MPTPALAVSARSASPLRRAKRWLFIALLKPIPFHVQLWLARTVAPNLVRYLPGGRAVVIRDYAGRFRMELNTRYPIETMMIVGEYERGTRRVVQRLVEPGYHCIDAGANVGAIAFLMADRVGGAGKVLAFEPAPATFARLERNIALNPDVQRIISPCQAGLGANAGQLHLVADDTVVGNAALKSSGGVEVPIETIDHAFARSGWSRLDFVKIDVEGMEYEVFQGARATFAGCRPIIFFESMEENWRDRPASPFEQIEAQLKPLGYEFLEVHPDGRVVPASSVRHGDNTLAIPIERSADVRQRLLNS